jgi:ABC-type sugar transport system permease subunit
MAVSPSTITRRLGARLAFPTRRRRPDDLGPALIFLAPSIVGLLVLQIIPIGTALVLGFSEWNVIDPMTWVGLRNFRQAFDDPAFYDALRHTLYLTGGLEVLNTVLGMGVALLLNTKLRGIGIYRTIYFLPLATTWAAVAIAWRYLYSESGPIKAVLGSIGLPTASWLSSPEWAMPAVILTITWKTLGWKAIILLAGLQGVSQELYDAATVDGASRRRQFLDITLPLITPALFFALIIGVINTLQLFDPIYIMTAGGPADATRTLGYYIYSTGFERLEMGYAAALSWILFVLIMLFTLVQWRLQRRWVFYQ